MTCCDSETPATPKRRRSFERSSPEPGCKLNLSEEPVLIPLLEDLAIWLSGFLATEINPENFIELFQDGVKFCKLATILHNKAVEYKEQTQHSTPLPSYAIKKWYPNPKVGSFFCRDNVCKFINWCKQFGVSEICLFESNDIVEHRTVRALRNVLICLLDVGKIGVKHGIEPSELVRIDLEIEQEIQAELLRVKNQAGPAKNTRIPRKNSSLNSSVASSSEPPSSEEEEEEERPVSSPEPNEEELERYRLKLLSLDEQVRAIVSRCTCKTPFQLDRVGDGKYKLPQTSQIFFVRILRNHVMVRVGGGWDTLDHFIAKHDPCRMKFKQIVGLPNIKDVKSRISTSWSSTPAQAGRRNRSSSLMTSPPDLPAPGPWVLSEDLSPLTKHPRPAHFSRSRSARFARRISYSDEDFVGDGNHSHHHGDSNHSHHHGDGNHSHHHGDSNHSHHHGDSNHSHHHGDSNHAHHHGDSNHSHHHGDSNHSHHHGGSEGSTTSSLLDYDDTLEECFTPLVSFKSKKMVVADHHAPLTLFNQSPRKLSSEGATRTPRRPKTQIPVPTSRSKSCERKGPNTVSNLPVLKHSKSGEVVRANLVTPARKLSTPPSVLRQTPRERGLQLQECLNKTPRSLLSNPTSATARKILKSKSSDNLQKHLVSVGAGEVTSGSFQSSGRSNKGLVKSKSTDMARHNTVSMRRTDQDVIMKPDLEHLKSVKAPGRSFRDWLRKRKNEG